MISHKGKRLFITGIPTAGKSYLAGLLAKEVGGKAVSLDDFREGLSKDEGYKKWVNFFLDKDEKEYYTKTSPDEQWANLIAQSEGLWPAFLAEINKHSEETNPVIFECVNLLPHLLKQTTDDPVIVLIGESIEEVRDRNKKDPRWGKTEELQELEAHSFFMIERSHYIEEAAKYSYPIYKSADDAFSKALKLLK